MHRNYTQNNQKIKNELCEWSPRVGLIGHTLKEGFCNSNETCNTIVFIEIIKSNGRHDLDSWCSLSAPFHGCMVIVWGLLTEICSGQGNVPDELLQLATICCSSLGLEIQIRPHFSSKFATDESCSSKSSSKSLYSSNPGCD
jgi:hypothetical protein